MQSLYQCALFHTLPESQVDELLRGISTYRKTYQKEEVVFHQGDTTDVFGVILSGNLYIQEIDFWGNRFIFANLKSSDIFAETFAFLKTRIHVEVIAASECEILFLKPLALLQKEPWLSKHFLQLLASKNLMLTTKIRHVTQRTTQAKLLTYLSDQALHQQSSSFCIPFNRQELADYLAVERTALSLVLSKLSKAGYLTFHRNKFTLLKNTIA